MFSSLIQLKTERVFKKRNKERNNNDNNNNNKLGLSCAKLIKLEVIVEVVVKVSSQIRGHSVLLQMGGCGGYVVGGWLGKLRI